MWDYFSNVPEDSVHVEQNTTMSSRVSNVTMYFLNLYEFVLF